MLLVRTRRVQPSSTSLVMEIVPIRPLPRSTLDELMERLGASIEDGRLTVHWSDVIPTDACYEFYHVLEMMKLGRVETKIVESPIRFTHEVMSARQWYDVGVVWSSALLIVDLCNVCRVGCPWCYASPPNAKRDKIDAELGRVWNLDMKIYKALRKIERETGASSITVALSGSGDPMSVEPWIIRNVIEAVTAYRVLRCKPWVFSAISTADVIRLLDSLEVLSGLTEVSISLLYGRMLRMTKLYRGIDPDDYGYMVAEAINELARMGIGVSLQVIVKRTKLQEHDLFDLRSVLRKVFDNCTTSALESLDIILLRYCPPPWFRDFEPPTVLDILLIAKEIADLYPLKHRTSRCPVHLDLCGAAMIFGIDPREAYRRKLIWRMPILRRNAKPQPIKECPRLGGPCKVLEYVVDETNPYGE